VWRSWGARGGAAVAAALLLGASGALAVALAEGPPAEAEAASTHGWAVEFGPAPTSAWVVTDADWAEAWASSPDATPVLRLQQPWRFEHLGEGTIAWAGRNAAGEDFGGVLDVANPVLMVAPAEGGAAWAAALSEGALLRVSLLPPAEVADPADPGDLSAAVAARARAAAAANAAALEASRQLRPGGSAEAPPNERPRRRLTRERAEELGIRIFGRS